MAKPRKRVVLVFGEDDNDRSSIIELVRAIRPDATVQFQKRHRPLVLLTSAERKETKDATATEIARLVKAESVLNDVVAVLAHRDCDGVEPAHIEIASTIESELKRAGVSTPVAVTPAFEMEAWWLLFPEAIAQHRPCWRKIPPSQSAVGNIFNVKEHLRRQLRPTKAEDRRRCPDYCESDGPIIAQYARNLGLIVPKIRARSASLDQFWQKIQELTLA